MNEQQVRAYLGGLADSVEVGPPPVAEVLESRPGPGGRVLVVGGALALAVAATIVAVVLIGGGDEAPRPVEPATQVPSQSGAGAWWTPGSIHFGTGVLRFDDIEDPTDDVGWMAPAPDGVIVGLVDGTIAVVDTSGQVTEVGRFRTGERQAPPGPNFVVDQTDGLIAWTDGDRLFVYDPESRRIVGERGDSARYAHAAWLLGFDDGKVYWDDRFGDRIWDWVADTTRRVGGGGSYIHGVRAGTWLVEHRANAGAYGILAEENEGGHSVGLPKGLRVSIPGFSPDGALVALTGSAFDRIVVLRVDDPTAQGIELDLPPGSVMSAAWRDDRTLVVVVREGERDSVARTLLTCSATTGACDTEHQLEGPVVLAGDGLQVYP